MFTSLGILELKLSSPSALDPGGERNCLGAILQPLFPGALSGTQSHCVEFHVSRCRRTGWGRRFSGFLAVFHFLVLCYLQGLLHSLASIWDTAVSLQQMHSLSHSFMLQMVSLTAAVQINVTGEQGTDHNIWASFYLSTLLKVYKGTDWFFIFAFVFLWWGQRWIQ